MRNNKICIRVDDKEYDILKAKAEEYNYQYVSSYIRDIALNEIVMIESIEGKHEVCHYFDQVNQEMKTQERQLANLIYEIAKDENERHYYEGLVKQLIDERKRIEKLINEKLFTSYTQEEKFQKL